MSGCYAPALSLAGQCTCKCHVSQNHHCDNCKGYPLKPEDDVSPMVKQIQYLQEQINELVEQIRACSKDFDYLKERIEKLDKAYKADFEVAKDIIFAGAQTCASILRCEDKIKELERFQDITHKQHENVIRKKQPYKCPVCDGKRHIPEIGNPPHLDMCLSCDGTGIVWG